MPTRPPWPSGLSAAAGDRGPRPIENCAATSRAETPDYQANWYVYFANFLLDRHADEAALVAKVQMVESPAERPSYEAGVDYFISVRRQLAGDKAGAMKMLEKCAATNSRNEIQWFESTLRLGIASGKIPSPQKPEAGNWRAELPKSAAGDSRGTSKPAAEGKDEEKPKARGGGRPQEEGRRCPGREIPPMERCQRQLPPHGQVPRTGQQGGQARTGKRLGDQRAAGKTQRRRPEVYPPANPLRWPAVPATTSPLSAGRPDHIASGRRIRLNCGHGRR